MESILNVYRAMTAFALCPLSCERDVAGIASAFRMVCEMPYSPKTSTCARRPAALIRPLHEGRFRPW